MRVIPAIDLRGGLCVRLRQGDYDRETVFSNDPALMAARWEAEGATLIHLVDLDGAKSGRPVNVGAVRRILERVIVGTQALRDPDWFRSMAENYPGRLVLGLDARAGKLATQGWLETSRVDATTLAEQFEGLPLAGIIYTDIARDGTLEGPNLDATRALAERVKTPVIASGGVGCLADLQRLARLPIAGCIVGRALYEGTFSLVEAIAHVEAVLL